MIKSSIFALVSFSLTGSISLLRDGRSLALSSSGKSTKVETLGNVSDRNSSGGSVFNSVFKFFNVGVDSISLRMINPANVSSDASRSVTDEGHSYYLMKVKISAPFIRDY